MTVRRVYDEVRGGGCGDDDESLLYVGYLMDMTLLL